MPLQTVRHLCKVSDLVSQDGLVDQIANLEDLPRIDPDAFFRRNHFTEGLRTLVYNGFERLSGRSDGGAFYLSQSMGGGKTHSLIAFALLAQNEGLRKRILQRSMPGVAEGATFGAAKVVIFNGHQNPANFLWGHIADKLDRPEIMARFWQHGATVPGVDEWIKTIGDDPIVILLDELPSYLQMAEGQKVGNSTLADITIGALERLFNALSQLPRACVIVTNLMDDVFAEGSAKLKTLISTLNKQYGKYAQAITPVQQNSGEIFEIIRKKLFDELPGADLIEEVGQAYVDALNQAKRVDEITLVPETFISRIRETYPFHPSIRDIVARFKENPGYQQTRALIRILRLAVRNAWKSDESIFLVGLQHLDFNHAGTIEEIRKINSYFINAISKDIADRGNSLAEQVDAADGNSTATSVSKLILMSSLSLAQDPILGLRRNEIIEGLVDPLTKTAEISKALDKVVENASYLFKGVDERIYFGQTANVTSEINETALSLAEEVVDQELRKKLEVVFKPTGRKLYGTMSILPSLDQVEVAESTVTLVVLERPAQQLPADFKAWWDALDRQNRVLALTADMNAVGTLRNLARQIRAIEIVGRAIKARPDRAATQVKEVEAIETRAANQFLSALRETFKTIVFPTDRGMREYGDFEMAFDNNDYSGEDQIVDVLAKRGKYIKAEALDSEIDLLRAEAEEQLFDADAVPRGELHRKAAARAGWYWLPPNGLDHLIDECCRRKYWRERERSGLIEKKFERVASVSIRLEGSLDEALERGSYRLTVTREDADTVFFSEKGAPDPKTSGKVSGTSFETSAHKVWFLAVDSKKEAKTGEPYVWEAPIHLRAVMASTSGGYRLETLVIPRAAEIHATFDGREAKRGPVVANSAMLPPGCAMVRVAATIDGRWSTEQTISIGSGLGPGPGEPVKEPEDNKPVRLKERIGSKSTKDAYDLIAALREAQGAKVFGGRIESGRSDQDDGYMDTTFGGAIGLGADEIENILNTLAKEAGFKAERVSLAFNETAFMTGKDFKNFADKRDLDYETLKWAQDEVG
ncbi:DUF499 domain-containing protein [Methylocystis sp. JAN1]|uniref:DUF499 domain-containing protein n=1 Tax=Methylocystis sp. JAN1 TaxID=3397211 RepID=UPI003FA1E396